MPRVVNVGRIIVKDPDCLLCKGNHAAWEDKCSKRVRKVEIIRVRSKKRRIHEEIMLLYEKLRKTNRSGSMMNFAFVKIR